MRYVSTRGGMDPVSFTDVLLGGLAPDGGLVVPETIPVFTESDLAAMRGTTYQQVAFEVVRRFVDDIPEADLETLVQAAYAPAVFSHPDVVSMREIEPRFYVAGLSHGPTLAFKDMALQLLGQLFEYELGRRGTHLTVLGATSGDTGSSAEYAMIGKHNVDVFMLSPDGRTSPFQAAQMYSLDEPNIFNLVVLGVFDECQDIVKAVNADAEFKARYHVGAVNSINWGRIVAQVAYYVYTALQAGVPEREVCFAVPTGNFGNAYAGSVARRMGVPIRRLIVATNENDVLAEFFAGGEYRVRDATEVVATSSPSMDISKASNFERYVYALTGDDPIRTATLFAGLEGGGGFELSSPGERAAVEASGFVAGSSNHEMRIAAIRRYANEFGIDVDPHTADGLTVGERYAEPGIPLICLETAQPVKFSETMEEALGQPVDVPMGLADLLDRPQRFDVIAPNVDDVKAYVAAHANPSSNLRL